MGLLINKKGCGIFMLDKRNVFCFRTSLTLILHSNLLNLAGISFRNSSYLSFEIVKLNFRTTYLLDSKIELKYVRCLPYSI